MLVLLAFYKPCEVVINNFLRQRENAMLFCCTYVTLPFLYTVTKSINFPDMANLSLGDSNSEHESDLLGPLPTSSWPGMHPGHPYPTYNSMPYSYQQQLPGSNGSSNPPMYQSGGMPNGAPPAYHNGMQSDDSK